MDSRSATAMKDVLEVVDSIFSDLRFIEPVLV